MISYKICAIFIIYFLFSLPFHNTSILGSSQTIYRDLNNVEAYLTADARSVAVLSGASDVR